MQSQTKVPCHDEIQLLLLDRSIREKLLRGAAEMGTGELVLEKRFKVNYEPEIFLDALESWRTNDKLALRVWEIKPCIYDLGDTLRQLNKYKQVLAEHYREEGINFVHIVLLYAESKYDLNTLKRYFGNASVDVIPLSKKEEASQ